MRSSNRGLTMACALLALILVQSVQSVGASEGPFYAGKTVRIIAGFAPGGTIDLRARLFARYLVKYIPGNPAVIVQNMTGAGGLVAANYAFGVAKPDGLTLLHFPSSTVMNTFLTTTNIQYDIRKVPIIWLGSDSWLTVINPKSTQVRKAEDLSRFTSQLRVGGSGVTSLRSLRPKLALELFGIEHTWVTGYKGSSDLLLAFEKGEIHLFEDPQDGYKSNIQPREKEGIATVVWQTGMMAPDESFKRSELLPQVPTLDEVLPKEKNRGEVGSLESRRYPAGLSIFDRSGAGSSAGANRNPQSRARTDDPGSGISRRLRESPGRLSGCFDRREGRPCRQGRTQEAVRGLSGGGKLPARTREKIKGADVL